MKIKYEFVNGKTEIEVTEEWGSVLIELHKKEARNNYNEHRHREHFESLSEPECEYGREDDNLLAIIGRNDFEGLLIEAIDSLTPDQKDLVQKIYFENWSVNKYAEMLGVDASAVSHRLMRIRNRLKKFFTDRQM